MQSLDTLVGLGEAARSGLSFSFPISILYRRYSPRCRTCPQKAVRHRSVHLDLSVPVSSARIYAILARNLDERWHIFPTHSVLDICARSFSRGISAIGDGDGDSCHQDGALPSGTLSTGISLDGAEQTNASLVFSTAPRFSDLR